MYPDENARRPPVPKHTEKPVMGLKSNKNFITNNAVENIMSVPKKPAAKFADTKDGKINDLEPSGLVPKYLKKKDYGKTPAYLVQRKEDMEQAQRDYDEYVRENMKRGAMNCLTNGERLVNYNTMGKIGLVEESKGFICHCCTLCKSYLFFAAVSAF